MSSANNRSNVIAIRLLIDGYLRHTECHFGIQVPRSILNIIRTFYPLFRVYAIGRNDHGQFGLGHRRPLNKFKRLKDFSQLITNVNDIYCNKGRFIIKTMQNELFAAGTNIFGQSALPLSQRRYTRFRKIVFPIDGTVDAVSCGTFNRHSFIRLIKCNTNNYVLFAFGNNASSQFGNNCKTNEYHRNTWIYIQLNNHPINKCHIKKIVCSDQHSLFLSNNGALYSCGDNDYGTAGLPQHVEEALTPTQIIIDHFIMDIACGMWHNICVDSLNNVWVFGANLFGQIGITNDCNNEINGGYLCFEPMMNMFFASKGISIFGVECGITHSLCIDLNGNIYLFGQSDLGQIGDDKCNSDAVFIPYLLQSNDAFKDIHIIDASCGANHNVLLSSDNKVMTFGDNKYRQCSAMLFDKHNMEIVKHPYVLSDKEINNNMCIEKVLADTNSTLIIQSVFKKWM